MLKRCMLELALLSGVVTSALPRRQDPVWSVDNFDSLITFGDSYTDENRLSYIIANNGSTPPAGTYFPEGQNTASGGRTWPRFVVQYTGSEQGGAWTPGLTLYDYAVSGAVCSNEITPRQFTGASWLFPGVIDYEVPAYLADRATNRNGTDQPYFSTALSASNAVYSLWIGTNDLGVGLFHSDAQVRGLTLTDYTSCIFQVFDELYVSGARAFVLFNNAPLQLSPLYGNASVMGVTASKYWNPKPENLTAVAEKMHEYTTSTNTIFRYQTPYESLIAGRYPGASIALFNVWQLISDIYDNPTAYLNGSEPANVTGFENQCPPAGGSCQLMYNGTSSDSFLWFDELHPSEQTDRIIARNFVDVLNGNSTYAQYF